ncbi:hypothetical protein LMG26857_01696 [Achromobacter anxifer]|uniref:VOC family protein n=1 Tax=Achromobacter anxifer TaxID=1287737 RepID=UPI00155B7F65|nr:VOC family protein [Achromobacter anxifer]CAB5512406.1 hypothetical protein LMG26857_01696 [Achromobacter anxifer]
MQLPVSPDHRAFSRLCRARDLLADLRSEQVSVADAAFESADIQAEAQRLKQQGVVFTIEPTAAGPVTIAIFSDTCGNLIQIYQLNS